MITFLIPLHQITVHVWRRWHMVVVIQSLTWCSVFVKAFTFLENQQQNYCQIRQEDCLNIHGGIIPNDTPLWYPWHPVTRNICISPA